MSSRPIYVNEDPPPATRPRWYVYGTPGFDSPDEAVSWARLHGDTVIVRTLGSMVFYAGQRPEWDDHGPDGPMLAWPPTDDQRDQIEQTYASELAALQELDRQVARYEAERDAWLGQLGHADLTVGHRCRLGASALDPDPLELEEFGETDELCGGRRGAQSAFGDLRSVLSELADPLAPAGWIDQVCDALERDRRRSSRRQTLLVIRGSGEQLHVTAAANRESIRTHGLDWRRMNRPGIAGSRGPEIAGTFVAPHIDDTSFFRRMARTDVDIWAVRVDGLWLESDPNGVGSWWVIPEPVAPARLRLAARSLPRERA